MKELTIEEKAKAYDEALKVIKECVPDKNGFITIYPQEIFPELKESEGENMKKSLITFFRKYPYSIGDAGINPLDAIAWLEKQGEQKANYTTIVETGDGGIRALVTKELPTNGCDDEQKPADKVEPKFHEGDWITKGKFSTQIVAVGSGLYVINRKGMSEVSLSTKYVEKWYHLWTIQDAKDGDVLATEPIEGYHSPFIAIYKKQNEEDFDSYCFIGFDGKFYKGENGHSTEKVHPATKEQCSQLGKAMADAGYTFDFEKKELKKIEQKSAEWSEDDEGFLNLLLAIFTNEHQNGVFSTNGITVFKGYCVTSNRIIAWLKSLKDRVQPQKQWKPSDEQMNTLEYYMHTLVCNEHKEILFGLYTDLKYLKKRRDEQL